MDGENDGATAQAQVAGEPQALGDQAAVTAGLKGAGDVGDGDNAAERARTDYEAALKERDERIAALEGEIAEAARTAESTERLRAEMDELRRAQRKEIMVPKIQVSGLGNYTRNVGYKTGSITYEFETKVFNYDRGIHLLADVMDVEEEGVLDCFVAADSELQRTQVAPEANGTFVPLFLIVSVCFIRMNAFGHHLCCTVLR